MTNKNLFIEVSREKRYRDGHTGSSDLRDATELDIASFKSRPCGDHSSLELLCYDEPGYMYDVRFCAVCNKEIGFI